MNQSTLPVRNEQAALAAANNKPEIAAKIFGMFISEIPKHLERLHKLNQAGQYADAAREAHKMKGSSLYCGLESLTDTLIALQNTLEQPPASAVDLNILQTEIDKVLALAT